MLERVEEMREEAVAAGEREAALREHVAALDRELAALLEEVERLQILEAEVRLLPPAPEFTRSFHCVLFTPFAGLGCGALIPLNKSSDVYDSPLQFNMLTKLCWSDVPAAIVAWSGMVARCSLLSQSCARWFVRLIECLSDEWGRRPVVAGVREFCTMHGQPQGSWMPCTGCCLRHHVADYDGYTMVGCAGVGCVGAPAQLLRGAYGGVGCGRAGPS